MYSSQELATAVQQGCNITHFIWNDGKYNMVEFQEVEKYGRSAVSRCPVAVPSPLNTRGPL